MNSYMGRVWPAFLGQGWLGEGAESSWWANPTPNQGVGQLGVELARERHPEWLVG